MKKQEILDRINKIIVEEKGREVSIDGMFIDSELDSLGVMITFVTLDAEFGFLKDIKEGEEFDGLENLTVRDLIKQCILSSTSTSTVPKIETVT